MQIPNGLGVLFALGQLVLYAMFYKNTQQIIEARKRKADQQGTMMEVVTDATPPNNNGNTY
jgi:solute carrier family 50 protein (sugar transporter)